MVDSVKNGNAGILYEAIWKADELAVDGSASIAELAARLRAEAARLENMASDGCEMLYPVEQGGTCLVTRDPVAARSHEMIAYDDEVGLEVDPQEVADA